MIKRKLQTFFIVFLWSALFSSSIADEGIWLLNTTDQLPIDSLKAMGLKLDPEEIYNPKGIC